MLDRGCGSTRSLLAQVNLRKKENRTTRETNIEKREIERKSGINKG
jgi:hypothetical protein